VRISYPKKAATIEAAAMYKSTLSAEDAKDGAEGHRASLPLPRVPEGPAQEPARRATTRSIRCN
jgi:hypothetical protein